MTVTDSHIPSISLLIMFAILPSLFRSLLCCPALNYYSSYAIHLQDLILVPYSYLFCYPLLLLLLLLLFSGFQHNCRHGRYRRLLHSISVANTTVHAGSVYNILDPLFKVQQQLKLLIYYSLIYF